MTTNTAGLPFTFYGMRPLLTRIAKKVVATIGRVRLANQIARERRMLASLTDYQLKDIGLTRSDVHEEIRKDYWDLPRR